MISNTNSSDRQVWTRRSFLAFGAAATAALMAGCDAKGAAAHLAPARGGLVREAPRSGSGWVARHGLTEAQYRATFDDLFKKQGFRIVDISGYQSGGSISSGVRSGSRLSPRTIELTSGSVRADEKCSQSRNAAATSS